MLCMIEPEEANGETVNDAIYNRNVKVEQKLNCTIEEINEDNYYGMDEKYAKVVMANDDIYDVVYMPMFYMINGLTLNYYQNLNDIETLHLDESWWDQILLDSSSLADRNYFATSSAHLMGWDGLWCIFFNESMMDDLGMEYPYQLVKDGKWTLDALSTYCKNSASLNGDEAFVLGDYDKGNSRFGFVSFTNVVDKFLFGLDADFVSKDKNDVPVISFTDEKFINAAQKLANFMNTAGSVLNAGDNPANKNCYSYFFDSQRAVFLGAELKTAQGLREKEWSFGILPYPKLDENQENYRSTSVHQCAVFTIPITNNEPEKAGLLFDALSFESDLTVLDKYFTILVEQKGLRNEESIEMLNIIKETRSFDTGVCYQWITPMTSTLYKDIQNGGEQIVSMIAANKNIIQDSISTTVEWIEENK